MNGRTGGAPICFFIVMLVPHRRNDMLVLSLTVESVSSLWPLSFFFVAAPFIDAHVSWCP